MLIDLETPKYYRGLGDLVMWAWLAEGAKSTQPMRFHRIGNRDLAAMLGLDVVDEPGGLSLDDVYDAEKLDRGRRPRVDYIRHFLGLTNEPKRPPLHIADVDEQWVADFAAKSNDPLVLLFPQTLWKTREWPANYWVDVAWKLKSMGVRTEFFLQGKDERFTNTPSYHWNVPLPRVAAAMRRARLVVGNDSFPAHLAGTVGVPTLALMGPTRTTVFSHIPDVECLSSDMDCTGCHFQSPFRAACDQGCMSLYRLLPDDVLRRITERLSTS